MSPRPLTRRSALRRSARTNLVPAASRLPPELLCGIFRFLDFRHCVTASHVSARWRLAALGDRVLWASLDMAAFSAGYVCLQTFLARSGSTLRLEIRELSVGYTNAEAVGLALNPHMHRLGVLQLKVDGCRTMSALHTSILLRTPAPMLKEFALHHTFVLDAEPLVLLPNVFRGQAPQLARLTLDGVQLDADGAYPAFAHVTNLRHFGGVSLQPGLLPQLTDCAFVNEYRLGTLVGPLTNPLRRLSFVSPNDLIAELLTQLGPLALVETREMDIDCPCSADAMLYVVQAIDAPFGCEIHTLNTKSLDVYMSIEYEDGRTRRFRRPIHISTILPVLERVAHKCASLTCPARLLRDIPPLRTLRKLNVDLEDNFTHSEFLDAAISSALSLEHTPHLRSLTLMGHGTAYTRLRPRLFFEIIQRRRITALPRADTFRKIILDGIKFAGETESASGYLRRLAILISLRVRQGDDDESAPLDVAGTLKNGRTCHGAHDSVGKRGVREMGKLLAGQRRIQMDSPQFHVIDGM